MRRFGDVRFAWSGPPASRQAQDHALGLEAGLAGQAPQRQASNAWLDGWAEAQAEPGPQALRAPSRSDD